MLLSHYQFLPPIWIILFPLAFLATIVNASPDGHSESGPGPFSNSNSSPLSSRPTPVLSLGDIAAFIRCRELHFRCVAKPEEEERIPWMLGRNGGPGCFPDGNKKFERARKYFGELHDKMGQWNDKLEREKDIAREEHRVVYEKIGREELLTYQAEQPRIKLNLLSQVIRAQHLKIVIHFLHILLNGDPTHRIPSLFWIQSKLKTEDKIPAGVNFDLERYKNKLRQSIEEYNSLQFLLRNKFDYFQLVTNFEDPIQRITFGYDINDLMNALMKVQMELHKTRVIWEGVDTEIDQFWTKGQNEAPTVKQTLWLVRHAKRVDNELFHKHLDPALSEAGEQQVKEIAQSFKSVPIDHIFSSPYKRTMQTATALFGEKKNWYKGISIKVEPGLAEFYKPCQHRFGFSDTAELATQFPRVDLDYCPAFSKNDLPLPKANVADQREEECNLIVKNTLMRILQEYNEAKNIVLVAHSGTIALVHELLRGQWTAVGQATVSKFVQFARGHGDQCPADPDSPDHSSSDSILDHFRMEYSSDSSFLSDRSELQPY